MAKSKIILIPLIITVFIFSLICCCITHLSPVQDTSLASLSHVPACHRHAASKNTSKEAPADDCKCHKVIGLAIQKLANEIKLAPSEEFKWDTFLSAVLFHSNFNDSQIDLALAQAPPDRFSLSIPLYIQHSNLRL